MISTKDKSVISRSVKNFMPCSLVRIVPFNHKIIFPFPTMQNIFARTAIKSVRTFSTSQLVITKPTDQNIVTTAAIHDIMGLTSKVMIITSS